MTNKELAAQCLIEAAELLEESAGRNGQTIRYWEERAKILKKQNEKDKKKREMYKRAGYEDKSPDRGNWKAEADARNTADILKHKKRDSESLARNSSEYLTSKDMRDARDWARLIGRTGDLASWNGENDFSNVDTPAGRHAEKVLSKKPNPLHKRINDRAKSKNESVDIDALLEEAMDLLDY